MAFPPQTLPTTRTNADPQQDTHPDDHNEVNGAVNDIVTELTDINRDIQGGELLIGTSSRGADPDVAQDDNGVVIRNTGIIESHVTGPPTTNYPSINLIRSGNAGAAGASYIRFGRSSANTGAGGIAINAGGGVDFNQTSDPRMKVADGEITDAAARVIELARSAFSGHWAEDENATPWDFLSAHDIEDAAPYAVTGKRDARDADGNIDPMFVDYTKLVPLLTKALGEALERIEALETA